MNENVYVNGFATMNENAYVNGFATMTEIARESDFTRHGKDASLIEKYKRKITYVIFLAILNIHIFKI